MSRVWSGDGEKPKRVVLKDEDVMSLLNSGINTSDIGAQLGVTRGAIYHRLIKLGVKKKGDKRMLSKDEYCRMLGEKNPPTNADVPRHVTRWAFLFRIKRRSDFNKSYDTYLKTGEIIVDEEILC